MRKATVATLGLTLLLVATYLAWGKPPRRAPSDTGPSRPEIKHVILLTIDTLRADALPFHGSTRIASPNLTGLCRQGICFGQAQAPSPWTRPSITSLLTGLHPSVHATVERAIETETVLPESTRTLAECMRGAGYRTAGIGYNPFLAYSPNTRRGFQDYWFYPTVVQKSDGNLAVCTGKKSRPFLAGRRLGDAEIAADEHNSTAVLTRLAEHWLERHGREKFFLWLHYYDPHNPYTPTREYGANIPDKVAPTRDDAFAAWVIRTNSAIEEYLRAERAWLRGEQTDESEMVRRGLLPVLLQHKETIRALYESEITRVDEAVGRVLDKVKSLGIYDETLIVFTSDHGEEFGDHGRFEHGHTLYQELLHVPLVIKPPGRVRAKRVEQRVAIESVYATILELCSIARSSGPRVAPSLAPHWASTGPESPAPDPAPDPDLVANSLLYGEPATAVIFGTKKYIRRTKSDKEELYDLAGDPGERESLASREPGAVEKARRVLKAHATRARSLRRQLWPGRVPTTAPDEKTRKVLRSHRYIK
jgi:arylsulfatase A-like enzyme